MWIEVIEVDELCESGQDEEECRRESRRLHIGEAMKTILKKMMGTSEG
jgi:hypothetical protein